jgi:hypothetical protein
MDELENCSDRYYHLEKISTNEIDFGKESELINYFSLFAFLKIIFFDYCKKISFK